MALNQTLEGTTEELFEAQAHLYKHIFSYASSMSLGCALELGIPDIIHNHNAPITLQQLVSKLNLPVEKTLHLQRLMRFLIHDNLFATTKFRHEGGEDEKEGYVLTLCSKLLIKKDRNNLVPSLVSFARNINDPVLVAPWQFMGRWFKTNESTPFETAQGVSIWEYAEKNPRINIILNEAMASDTEMVRFWTKYVKEVFEGIETIVDVGGGTGLFASIILEALPHMKCTVFDLPRVIAGQTESENLKYVGGDMFTSIPSADAILIKHVLHNWSDENVVKILKRCKEAVVCKDGKKGKVVIIEMVVGGRSDSHEMAEMKLIYDLLMMVEVAGKERTENEWEKVFIEAGFGGYKITPNFDGFRSLIEVFP